MKRKFRSQSYGSLDRQERGTPVLVGVGSVGVGSTGSSEKEKSPTPDVDRKPQDNKPDYVMALAIGIVNSIILVPVLVGFAHIIFRDAAFEPYMGLLTKAVLLSSTVHQIVFTSRSSLYFAIGQVQDAGLIFLCAMSSGIAEQWREDGGETAYPGKSLISTVTVGLGCFTALLGLTVVATGILGLAQYVQLLPVPVVGGYLAFIGFFCLEAGLAMMSGVELKGVLDWYKILEVPQGVWHTLPGLLLGLGMLLAIKRFRHFAALAISLMTIPAGFYLIIWITGTPLQTCRENGWVGNETVTPPFYEMWLQDKGGTQDALYQLSRVEWSLLPSQFPQWLAMYAVVAFSSSLDVAAIELDMGESLDYDFELVTVGWSNAISGLLGGFTGSYIFSQTILTRRAHTNTRLCGWTVVVLELVFVVMPYSILGYFPKCFFGAVLCFIGFALMSEWLVEVKEKVSLSEYALVWLTFLSIHATNLELGLLLALVGAVFHFLFLYSVNTPFLRKVRARSDVQRGFRQQTILMELRRDWPECIQTYQLRGHLFFASAVKILHQVKEHVVVAHLPGQGTLTVAAAHNLSFQASESASSIAELLATDRALTRAASLGSVRTPLKPASPGTTKEVKSSSSEWNATKSAHSYGYESNRKTATSSTDFAKSSSDDSRARVSVEPSAPRLDRQTLSESDTAGNESFAAFSAPSPWSLGGGPSIFYQQQADLSLQSDDSRPQPQNNSLEGFGDLEAAIAGGEGGTRFVIFDFKQVTGIDVTAVRSCFLILRHLLARHGATMLFADLSQQHARLFCANGVLDSPNLYHNPGSPSPRSSLRSKVPRSAIPSVLLFPTRAAAVEHAENVLLSESTARLDKILRAAKREDSNQSESLEPKSVEQIVTSFFRMLPGLPFRPDQRLPTTQLSVLNNVFELKSFSYGEDVFERGDPPSGFYFVASGEITLHQLPPPNADGTIGAAHMRADSISPQLSPALTKRRKPSSSRHSSPPNSRARPSWLTSSKDSSPMPQASGPALKTDYSSFAARGRFLKILSGGLFGELDFVVQQPRTFYATVTSKNGAVVWFHSLESRNKLWQLSPELFDSLRFIVLKSLCASALTIFDHEVQDEY
eukprot:g4561.t1